MYVFGISVGSTRREHTVLNHLSNYAAIAFPSLIVFFGVLQGIKAIFVTCLHISVFVQKTGNQISRTQLITGEVQTDARWLDLSDVVDQHWI